MKVIKVIIERIFSYSITNFLQTNFHKKSFIYYQKKIYPLDFRAFIRENELLF